MPTFLGKAIRRAEAGGRVFIRIWMTLINVINCQGVQCSVCVWPGSGWARENWAIKSGTAASNETIHRRVLCSSLSCHSIHLIVCFPYFDLDQINVVIHPESQRTRTMGQLCPVKPQKYVSGGTCALCRVRDKEWMMAQSKGVFAKEIHPLIICKWGFPGMRMRMSCQFFGYKKPHTDIRAVFVVYSSSSPSV